MPNSRFLSHRVRRRGDGYPKVGLGSAVLDHPGPLDPPTAAGEVSWGGLAGTSWWINPRLNIAGVLMTQRYYGQGGIYTVIFKNEAYKALGY